jgi:hypothetical protein
MADIFISYARADRDKVRPIAKALEDKGWSVWWDARIRSGEAFDRVIEKALAEARCVIVVWSANSVESDWVRAEAVVPEGVVLPAVTILPCVPMADSFLRPVLPKPVMFALKKVLYRPIGLRLKASIFKCLAEPKQGNQR